jgi:hypothetical protein
MKGWQRPVKKVRWKEQLDLGLTNKPVGVFGKRIERHEICSPMMSLE